MRLLPPPGRIASGSVLLGGRDLTRLSEREMAAVRGARIAMVYQDPMSSLNPVRSVGRQIVEAIRIHEDVSKDVAARSRDRSARRRRHRRSGAPLRQLPAPALGRNAPTRDDRDGDLRQPGRPDRRRADDGARRHDAGAHRRSARPARRRAGDGRDPDHARSRARRDHLRHDPRHVRGPDRRAQPRRAALRRPGASRTARRCSARSAGSTRTSTARSPRSADSRPSRSSSRPAAPSTPAARTRSTSARRRRRRSAS